MTKKKDEGKEETEKVLDELEERLTKEYAQAEKELAEKLETYLQKFEAKKAKKLSDLVNGKITQKEYDDWYTGQVLIGERWEEMKDTIAQDLTNTNQIAKSISFGYMPEVYAINYNYGTFQVEKESLVDTSFTMYNKQAVENLFRDDFDFYKPAGKLVSEKINVNKDLAWNKRQIQSIMTQSILQGESIPNMVKRLRDNTKDVFTADDIKDADKKTAKQIAREVERKNRNAAIRNARTMTTCVQNVGRVDAYKRAEDMGIMLEQEWIAALDMRTRHAHRELDGQRVPVGEKFKVDGYDIAFPADPAAPAYLVYNCRCSLAPALKGFKSNLSDRNTTKLGDMTYEEWKDGKKTTSRPIKTPTKKAATAKTLTKYSEDFEKIKNACAKVAHKPVEKLKKKLTDNEIIEKLAGGDKTKGSCSSVTFAYIANKMGLDVRDFRGGKSQEEMAYVPNIKSMLALAKANVKEYHVEREVSEVHKILMGLEKGKQYRLDCGKHSTIVRINDNDELEYLELQSQWAKGWTPFEKKGVLGIGKRTVESTLKKRFGCRKTPVVIEGSSGKKFVMKRKVYLTDIDTFEATDEFKEALGFINTEEGKEKKGTGGYAK